MTNTMTDKRALELVRWLTNGSDATPPPQDVTLQQAYDHIAARLSALQAQQPGAQAVAWRYLNPPDEGSTEWVASRWYDFPDESISAHERLGQRIEYAYLGQPPSIPEPSDAVGSKSVDPRSEHWRAAGLIGKTVALVVVDD